MPPRRPVIPLVEAEERRAEHPRQLLALSGGGFRGLFTVRVLERIEARLDALVATRFDLLAGTSIGGILALGLAAGFDAATLREKFEEHGSSIFHGRLTGAGGLFRSRYSQAGLRTALEAILGSWADRPMNELPIPVCIVAIDEQQARARIFRSYAAGGEVADTTCILDVALATSAAPTFFPPHQIGDSTLIDGGLIANAPDLVVAAEANSRWATPLSQMRILSIGTAGSGREGKTVGEPGAIGWLMNRRMIELTIDAQSDLAIHQLRRFGLDHYLRIDRPPRKPLKLDDVKPAQAQELINLADAAYDDTASTRQADLQRFFSHTPRR